ncbi:von Willebrand factor A domain-containing protein 5B1 [Corythoichthys intestinalis]|uniref:von Willebrand factor A domain-containing protein 5B1 n=1 Tax=Corythoichthys intestinalis TaxID=161448 RepID=UPI0025A4D6E2|nr:von Willebrand factor A domain-containing protein 5B1 [Corythoichthys intestinalis]XP_061803193.1 von Willebrand factor A domain-containing protein 5B1-like [Nerophis lumbriciformis]
MPGLINKENRSALPLSVSDITSCVRGYTQAMTASMTYENIEDHAIEGIFIYPLEEKNIVVGFEAMISSQIITLQIKDKAKIDDPHHNSCNTPNGGLPSGVGHILLDEDLERKVLVVNLGIIPPLETVQILVSTSCELSTLPSGGISVSTPPVCTPRVQRSINEEQGLSPNFSRMRDKHQCGYSPQDRAPTSSHFCLSALLADEVINSMDYEFNFQLEIRAPYLLAGVESPSHAIRADADPLARSATSVVITLADKYTYDCPVQILIYPSEPHVPQVLIESGDMTQDEYDEYIHGRSDFIKATKKDSSNETKVEAIQRRLHKDILHNPVVMLNLCPNFKPVSSDLRKVHGEFIFLIDCSGSMSGVNINRTKDALVVILKSLVPGCLFNLISFGSTFKSLFSSSQNYEEEALALACEYIRKIRADMGGTNILAPLKWILRQPMFPGHPRVLFLITDGAVSNTGKVIELVRSHARYIRCFTFGIGQNACRRMVHEVAAVSRGTAEFLAEGERLQPKMIKSLKKTMCPVLSDISIDWLFPETKEVLLSPVGNTFLYPGDSLIGYAVVCDATRYHANPKSEKRRRYSMMHSIGSGSSVFYHSQEEDLLKTSANDQPPFNEFLHDSNQDSVMDCCSVAMEHDDGLNGQTSARRRAYSTNQITEHVSVKKYTSSDPSSVMPKNPLRRAKVEDLIGQASPEHETQWKRDYQPQLVSLCAASLREQPSGAPCLLQHHPQGEVETEMPTSAPVCNTAGEDGSRSSTESPSLGSVGDTEGYSHQVCQAETPLDKHSADVITAGQRRGDCKVVVSGLLCGKAVQWEVIFDVEPYLKGREREEKVHEELWNETFHHLAARSIIHDFEHMVERERDIEHGSGRKYHIYAIHTSKACNILSKYTAFVPVDLDTNEYLPTCIDYINLANGLKRGSRSSSGSRKNRGYSIGLGRSQSGGVSEEAEDMCAANSLEDGASPCSTPSSSSWERCSSTEGTQRSPSVTSDQSQKSVESLFSARLALSRTRLLTKAAKGFMSRSHSRSGDSMGESDNENKDYIPLVLLQLACGAFPLDPALCDTINVPMDKLKWTSPFASHRTSLAHPSHSSSRRAESTEDDSGLSSDTQTSLKDSLPTDQETTSPGDAQRRMMDPESLVWATAVALAWLEHSSASYFIEWELVAAKASMWLSEQDIPEGRDVGSVKAAANQLFIILRHWDENLQLNMLCYNPNSV